MRMPVIKDISSTSETGRVAEGNLLAEMALRFPGPGTAYAILDYAVALGVLDEGGLRLGLGLERKVISPEVRYLQELRVFDEDREFRAIRVQDGFRWRLRTDGQGDNASVLEETQKLWGSAAEDRATEALPGDWTLLRARRGSAILFPAQVPVHGEKGLIVRHYLDFGQTTAGLQGGSLYRYSDERLAGLTDWTS